MKYRGTLMSTMIFYSRNGVLMALVYSMSTLHERLPACRDAKFQTLYHRFTTLDTSIVVNVFFSENRECKT